MIKIKDKEYKEIISIYIEKTELEEKLKRSKKEI